jgi:cytoskeletal protein RodZ
VFSLSELGKRLKETRDAKGLSLEDVQKITKIQKRYLQGIEEGNYSMMPGKFYVRAFIKQYAEAVGIEPEELFNEYKQDIPATNTEQLPDQLSRVTTKKTTITVGNSKVFDMLPKLLIGVFLIGAAALVYYLLQQNADQAKDSQVIEKGQTVNIEESDKLKEEKPKKDSEDQSKDVKETDSKSKDDTKAVDKQEEKQEVKPTQEVVMVTANGRKTTYELKNATKFEVKVATTGETWVNMLNGKGTSFFQGMLKKGATESQTFDFSKETEAVIVVGRATEAQIFVNDQPITYSVPPTEEVRQDITIRYVPKTE